MAIDYDVYYWPTPNGWKVTILLEELGAPYNIVPINIGTGQQFDPELVEHFIEVVQARDGSRQKEKEPVSNAVKLEIGREVEKLFVAVNT